MLEIHSLLRLFLFFLSLSRIIIIILFIWGTLFMWIYLLNPDLLISTNLSLLILLSFGININIYLGSDQLICKYDAVLIALYPRGVRAALYRWHTQLLNYLEIHIEFYWRSVYRRKTKRKLEPFSFIVLNIRKDWT